MPVMDGFESSICIREFDFIILIVALSAVVMQEDKELSKKAKMDEHMAKPTEYKKLEKVIQKYFEIKYE